MEGEVTVKVNVSTEVMTEEQILEANIEAFEKKLTEVRNENLNKEAAVALYKVYQAFLAAGFTAEQAWDLFIGQMANAGMVIRGARR
jgi:hypothetical protein